MPSNYDGVFSIKAGFNPAMLMIGIEGATDNDFMCGIVHTTSYRWVRVLTGFVKRYNVHGSYRNLA